MVEAADRPTLLVRRRRHLHAVAEEVDVGGGDTAAARAVNKKHNENNR